MGWSDFGIKSALERDVLRRALPLVPSSGQTAARATLDLAAETTDMAVDAVDTMGPTPQGCVELLGLRPLLTGTAWKVLDLLLEEALSQTGLNPDQRRGWSIDAKAKEARRGTGQPASIPAMAWAALMGSYDATKELRDSLVHRRVHTNAAGSLVGVDKNYNNLRPLLASEQDALARAALTAAAMVLAGTVDPRAEARLMSHLSSLSGVHRNSIAASGYPAVIPLLTVIVDNPSSPPNLYPLDVPAIRARQPFKESKWIDLVVAPRDRQGQELWGRLEEAPDEVVLLDPDAPPGWLSGPGS